MVENEITSAKADKIRVLFIDDEPGAGLSLPAKEAMDYFLDMRGGQPSRETIPVLRSQSAVDPEFRRPNLHHYFDMRWLATAAEAREFRDLSLAVVSADASALAEHGWVPEIVVFDYALTHDERAVAKRGYPEEVVAKLSPLPKLWAYARENKLNVSAPSARPQVPSGPTLDNLGCIAGGLIVAAFSDHPCAPVGTTGKVDIGQQKTLGSEVAFFEWMLERDFGKKVFSDAPRPVPTWNQLLIAGAEGLRSRIALLAREHLLDLNLDDLAAMEANGSHPVLRVYSRFGTRHLPVEGLFVDLQIPDTRRSAVRQWAALLWKDIWDNSSHSVAHFREGQALAKRIWDDGYDNHTALEERLDLSRLLHREETGTELTVKEAADLATLKSAFRYAKKTRTQKTPSVNAANRIIEMRMPGFSDEARHWAPLQLIVYLLQRKWNAEVQARADGDSCELVLSKAHIYFACFPLPERPGALPWHTGADVAETWPRILEKHGVDVGAILQGLGLTPKERSMLRHFAHTIRFERNQWERDPVARRILLGQEST